MNLIVSSLAGRQIDRLLATIQKDFPIGASRVRVRVAGMLELLTVHPGPDG